MTSQTLHRLCLESSEDLTAAKITLYALDAKTLLSCFVMLFKRGHAQLMFSSHVNSSDDNQCL